MEVWGWKAIRLKRFHLLLRGDPFYGHPKLLATTWKNEFFSRVMISWNMQLSRTDCELWARECYLGPQLPSEREAVGLFPRVSFRSCLRRQKSGKDKMWYFENVTRIFAYSVTDFGMGSLSKSINWLSSLNWFTYLEGKVIYFVHVQIGNICNQSLNRICHLVVHF